MAKDDIESAVCRVTHPAAKMDVDAITDVEFTMADIQAGDFCAIKAEFPEGSAEHVENWRTEEDSVTYQWYRYFAKDHDIADDIALAQEGNYEVRTTDVPITENANDTKFSPQSSGVYFCLVTNTYNGTTATRTSEFFTINEA